VRAGAGAAKPHPNPLSSPRGTTVGCS
jgi:hypothetical protein